MEDSKRKGALKKNYSKSNLQFGWGPYTFISPNRWHWTWVMLCYLLHEFTGMMFNITIRINWSDWNFWVDKRLTFKSESVWKLISKCEKTSRVDSLNRDTRTACGHPRFELVRVLVCLGKFLAGPQSLVRPVMACVSLSYNGITYSNICMYHFVSSWASFYLHTT